MATILQNWLSLFNLSSEFELAAGPLAFFCQTCFRYALLYSHALGSELRGATATVQAFIMCESGLNGLSYAKRFCYLHLGDVG